MMVVLGIGLVVCGIGIGWMARPLMFDIIADSACECGSEKKYKDCCLKAHIHETFTETKDEK